MQGHMGAHLMRRKVHQWEGESLVGRRRGKGRGEECETWREVHEVHHCECGEMEIPRHVGSRVVVVEVSLWNSRMVVVLMDLEGREWKDNVHTRHPLVRLDTTAPLCALQGVVVAGMEVIHSLSKEKVHRLRRRR